MATIQEKPATHQAYEVSASEIMHLLEHAPEKVFLVDIRACAEYDGGHIPGARNVPLEDLVSACADVLPENMTIVIYCGDTTCGLPLWGALELAQRGYCVKYLYGGLAEWSRRELPIEMTPPGPWPEC